MKRHSRNLVTLAPLQRIILNMLNLIELSIFQHEKLNILFVLHTNCVIQYMLKESFSLMKILYFHRNFIQRKSSTEDLMEIS